MRRALVAVMELIQWILVGISMLLSLPRQVLTAINRLDRIWIDAVYYRWVQLKRRVAGEDLWQSHDLSIGKTPPLGHPWWNSEEARCPAYPAFATVAAVESIPRDPSDQPP